MSYKKCVVWDLDNTLWDGICLEGNVTIKEDIVQVIKKLDERGILHSIASRGEESVSFKVLEANSLKEFFLVPKINWLQKTNNIISISKELNIPLESIAFIDDDVFELEQMKFMLPDVFTIHSDDASDMPVMKEFSPGLITQESKSRREFYKSEELRKIAESKFVTREDFLSSCQMKLKIRPMIITDTQRVLELMTRTHQLNTTGWIIEQSQLIDLMEKNNPSHEIYVAELEDKFGKYGIIGTAIIEKEILSFMLKYLAVSCRVMGRGIERAILISIMNNNSESGFQFAEAEFRETGKNRTMRALYQMMDFQQISASEDHDNLFIFKRELTNLPPLPNWLDIL